MFEQGPTHNNLTFQPLFTNPPWNEKLASEMDGWKTCSFPFIGMAFWVFLERRFVSCNEIQILGCPGTEVIGSKVIGSVGSCNPNIPYL